MYMVEKPFPGKSWKTEAHKVPEDRRDHATYDGLALWSPMHTVDAQ